MRKQERSRFYRRRMWDGMIESNGKTDKKKKKNTFCLYTCGGLCNHSLAEALVEPHGSLGGKLSHLHWKPHCSDWWTSLGLTTCVRSTMCWCPAVNQGSPANINVPHSCNTEMYSLNKVWVLETIPAVFHWNLPLRWKYESKPLVIVCSGIKGIRVSWVDT